MKDVLHNCGRLEVRHSPIEGYGVFALEDIHSGEILEEIPFVLFPKYTSWGKDQFDSMIQKNILSEREKYIENLRENMGFKLPEKYYFRWEPPAPHVPGGESVSFCVLPLGNGPIYNTSNSNNNATWSIIDNLFVFVAERDIKKGEEIKTFYGYFLDESGTIFNADTVFYMGIDVYNGQASIGKICHSHPSHFKAVRSNSEYMILMKHTQDSLGRGVRIKKIESDKFTFVVPPDYPVSYLYKKLTEFKSSRFDYTKFFIEYRPSLESQLITDVITLPNRDNVPPFIRT